MSHSMVATLIMKDLYMNRVFVTGSVLASLFALLVCTLNETGFTIGAVMFMTNIIALGIFLGIYSVVQEREKRTHVFVFSLPISAHHYYVAKLISALVSFLIPLTLSAVAGVITIISDDTIPDGMLPLLIVLSGFFLHNFCIFLSVSLIAQSEFWIVGTILVTNMSISLFFPLLNSVSTIVDYSESPVAMWSPAVFTILTLELVVAATVLAIAFTALSRRKDFL